MARRPREEVAGGVFHVYARGNDRRVVFADDVDRRRYLALLERVVARAHWYCLAYCLMDNHVHLLIETPTANLGAGMQWFHGHYARRFNDRHGGVGHLFQGRYGAVRATSTSQLQAAAAYIACNPTEAGMCPTPDAWSWSSHAVALAGWLPRWLAFDRLVAYFGGDGGDPYHRYRRAVDDRHRLARRRAIG
jgi:REP element-mobilizing transposase RayT